MDREMASTAPISQPLQYMMVTTRQTMPAGGRGRQGRQLRPGPTHTVSEGCWANQRTPGEWGEVWSRASTSGPERAGGWGQVQQDITGLQAIPSNIWLISGSKDLWGRNDCHPDSAEQRGILLGVGWGGQEAFTDDMCQLRFERHLLTGGRQQVPCPLPALDHVPKILRRTGSRSSTWVVNTATAATQMSKESARPYRALCTPARRGERVLSWAARQGARNLPSPPRCRDR